MKEVVGRSDLARSWHSIVEESEADQRIEEKIDVVVGVMQVRHSSLHEGPPESFDFAILTVLVGCGHLSHNPILVAVGDEGSACELGAVVKTNCKRMMAMFVEELHVKSLEDISDRLTFLVAEFGNGNCFRAVIKYAEDVDVASTLVWKWTTQVQVEQ